MKEQVLDLVSYLLYNELISTISITYLKGSVEENSVEYVVSAGDRKFYVDSKGIWENVKVPFAMSRKG